MAHITIPCFNDKSHEATLFLVGDQYEGIWECPTCDMSDVCPHDDTTPVIDLSFASEDYAAGLFDSLLRRRVFICDLCECSVDAMEESLREMAQDCE